MTTLPATDRPHRQADAAAGDLAGVVREMRAQLQSLRQELASLRGRVSAHESVRGGFASVLIVKGDTNGANWQQQWVGSNNASLTPFLGGFSNSASFIDPATATGGGTGVATLLQLRNGSNTAFLKIGGGATTIDVWSSTAIAASNVASVCLSGGFGTENFLRWAGTPPGGARTPAVCLEGKPGTNRTALQVDDSGNIVWLPFLFWT